MPSTFTLTATAEPAATPPRVRLDVGQTGTPALTGVNITRTDPDGRIRPVRSADGGPIPVSTTGVAYDYEVRYGASSTWTIAENNAPTATTTLNVGVPWLVHLGDPTKSVTADFRVGTNESEEWGITQGVFPVLGREEAIVITSGARSAPTSSLIVAVNTPTARAAIRNLLADGSILFLNVPASLGLGMDSAYIAIGTVQPKRRSSIGTDPYWDLELPYQVVARPAGGTRAAIAWTDVSARYATWSSVPTGNTWAQIAAGI